MFLTLASYFFRNLLKLCRLLFKVACSRRSFSSLSSFNELTRVVLGENFRWFMPLFKATENALLSSTVKVIITKKTAKVRDKLSDDFMVLLYDSLKINNCGYYWLLAAWFVLVFWSSDVQPVYLSASLDVRRAVLIVYHSLVISPLLCGNYFFVVNIV